MTLRRDAAFLDAVILTTLSVSFAEQSATNEYAETSKKSNGH